jgi:hypothetical protein
MWIERAARVGLIAASQFIEIKVRLKPLFITPPLFSFVFSLLRGRVCATNQPTTRSNSNLRVCYATVGLCCSHRSTRASCHTATSPSSSTSEIDDQQRFTLRPGPRLSPSRTARPSRSALCRRSSRHKHKHGRRRRRRHRHRHRRR